MAHRTEGAVTFTFALCIFFCGWFLFIAIEIRTIMSFTWGRKIRCRFSSRSSCSHKFTMQTSRKLLVWKQVTSVWAVFRTSLQDLQLKNACKFSPKLCKYDPILWLIFSITKCFKKKLKTLNPFSAHHCVGCTIVQSRTRIADILPEFQCISEKRGYWGSTLKLCSVWMLLNIPWSQKHDKKAYNLGIFIRILTRLFSMIVDKVVGIASRWNIRLGYRQYNLP